MKWLSKFYNALNWENNSALPTRPSVPKLPCLAQLPRRHMAFSSIEFIL
jgi:hypothetical protein